MTILPPVLRAAPWIFYVTAVIVFVIGIALPLQELSRFGASQALPADEAMFQSAFLQLVLRQFTEALYLFSNGVLIQVLIAIWDKLRPVTSERSE
jgi:hypothetical protein